MEREVLVYMHIINNNVSGTNTNANVNNTANIIVEIQDSAAIGIYGKS